MSSHPSMEAQLMSGIPVPISWCTSSGIKSNLLYLGQKLRGSQIIIPLSGIRVYGSPFSLISPLFPSLSPYSNRLHTLYSLFNHPNIPPIVCSMRPVSNSPPSLCDQTHHILFLFIPHPLDDRGPFLFYRHPPSSLTYPQARPLSLVVQGSAWGEGFPPSTTQQATCHITVYVWPTHTGGEGALTQWVHCEFVVSFEAIRPVITQQVCGEFF